MAHAPGMFEACPSLLFQGTHGKNKTKQEYFNTFSCVLFFFSYFFSCNNTV